MPGRARLVTGEPAGPAGPGARGRTVDGAAWSGGEGGTEPGPRRPCGGLRPSPDREPVPRQRDGDADRRRAGPWPHRRHRQPQREGHRLMSGDADALTETADPAFEALLAYLHEERGFDFAGYKRASLMRRVERRMSAAGIATFG